ncbi:MAG: caspase, EACC1-associated type [Thainema sp.]
MAKTALLIGTSQYQKGFKALPAAPKDVVALQAVLQNPEIGCFDDVQTLIDQTNGEIAATIETWFRRRQRDDLALLYFSGHGVKDDRGKLYFAASNTRKDGDFLISSTALDAAFVHECILRSRARRQVVILDCCFSGAFGNLTAKDDGALNLVEQLGAEGRVVLTSSSAVQYSFEQPGSDLSIYTRYLVEGIETGAADLNKDGQISVDELHQYAELKVKEAAPAMSPKIIVLKDEGFRIELAKVALGDPKLRYRQEVERVVQENQGFISELDRLDLDDIRDELNLSETDAKAIESSILQPFRELKERVEFYQRAFQTAIAQQYPLDELQRRKLKRIQDRKQLRDEDVQKIEAHILEPSQASKGSFSSTPEKNATNYELQVSTETSAQHALSGLDSKEKALLGEKVFNSTIHLWAHMHSAVESALHEIAETVSLASDKGINYTRLRDLLKAGEWEEADKETYEVMIRAVGKKSGDLLKSEELLNFPCADLKTIDRLWVKYSNGQFGFSVQKEIYVQCGAKLDGKYPGDKIWGEFCDRTGWRVNGSYIYYFDVTFSTSAPQGHLPFGEWEWVWVLWCGSGEGSLFSRIQTCKV